MTSCKHQEVRFSGCHTYCCDCGTDLSAGSADVQAHDAYMAIRATGRKPTEDECDALLATAARQKKGPDAGH